MNWFSNELSRRIGNGPQLSLWNDVWFGEICLKEEFPRLFSLSTDKVSSVANMGGGMVMFGGGDGSGGGGFLLGKKSWWICL